MNELEFLREAFKDPRLHIGCGVITQLGLSQAGNTLRIKLTLLPEDRDIIAIMTFSDVYEVTFPEVDDLCLVAFIDGHPDDAYVIKVVNTKDEVIPTFARNGDSTKFSRPGQKLWLGSDIKIGIGKPNTDSTENLVLGQQLKSLLSNVLNQISQNCENINNLETQLSTQFTAIGALATAIGAHTHSAGVIPVPDQAAAFATQATAFDAASSALTSLATAINTIKTQFDNYKNSPVDDGTILSDIAFTQKGGS